MKKQDEQDQHEGDRILVGRRQVAGAHGFEDAHQQAAHHRAQAIAQTADDCGDEALEAHHDPDVVGGEGDRV
jgi:hypothetical protein